MHSYNIIHVRYFLVSTQSETAKFCAKCLEVNIFYYTGDFIEALKNGSEPVAYARVMFIGKEGSGKSSLLDGLMGLSFKEGRDSTSFAEQKTLKYWWMQVETGGKRIWMKQTEEDQRRELAARSRKVANKIPRTEGRNELSTTEQIMVESVSITDTYQSHVDDISKRAMLQQREDSPDVLHVWDCGGQPVFLDILSAFISARTFFLLTFNAAESIHAQCGKSVWRLNGQQIPGRKRNITNIQLLIQWLQLIYTTVSSTQKKLVKAMLIGSRGDEILSTKDNVIESVNSACKDKAFGNILLKCVIVNNRTAGQGEREDPAYDIIRESIHSFIEDVTEDTPLSWISFRSMVMDLIKKGKNVYVLSKADASQIAKGCNIPNVDSVLEFYHQLGMFLYFPKSCPDSIFVNPHWLFQQLCKLLMPGNELQVTLAQRNFLDNSGILSSEVYQKVSRKCGLGDDDLVNILDNFDLAKQIPPYQAPETLTDKNIFFVPCMLQNIKAVEPKQGHVRSAPLHIVIWDVFHLVFSSALLHRWCRRITCFSFTTIKVYSATAFHSYIASVSQSQFSNLLPLRLFTFMSVFIKLSKERHLQTYALHYAKNSIK